MTWLTNPTVMTVRSTARKLGLTRMLANIRPRNGYEEAFDNALFSSICAGDIVWDVGANVGHYTKGFAEAVGESGRVFAFEPFPATAERLRINLEGVDNYELNLMALGTGAGKVVMQIGGDDLGATNRIVDGAADGVEIEVASGDEVVAQGKARVPNVVKIDTEGFELDVLHGMKNLLGDMVVRALFIEVHFGLLADRGMRNAPAEIERVLRDAGFKTRWVDASHIAAERGAQVA